MERIRCRLDVDPVGDDPQPVQLHDAPELREERCKPAVAAVRPDRLDHLVPADGLEPVGREEREEKPTLAARQLSLELATADRDGEPAAELHSRLVQADANIVPTRRGYNARERGTTQPYLTTEVRMAKQIKCECGFVVRGESDDDVVAGIEAHIASDHPELAGKVTRDDLLGWTEEV
jgi:predicted small metal-binding protein